MRVSFGDFQETRIVPKILIGVGAATQDDLWLVENFVSEEFARQALDQTLMGGGPVATALCVLGQLGHPTLLIDVCGGDPIGDWVLADLKTWGVSTQGVRRIAGARTARAVVMVRASDGARQITFLPSSAGEPLFDEEHAVQVKGARLLHINGRHENAAREAVKWAQASDVEISFDGGAGRYRESIRDLVEASHIRIFAREFASSYCGITEVPEMMKRLLKSPARVAVITDGVAGSYSAVPGGIIHHQPAHSVPHVVDSTGCGDVFHGAFIHGWISGWEVHQCASFASMLAAKNAEGLGGRYVLNRLVAESMAT
ncbi:MAG: PfkB family carbohydrate kinase [Prosthecobacter sp.]